jgi:uncharacterized membrane protein YidH (DUF202 family)
MKPKTIGGLALMLVGVGIIVYAFLLWNSNFQLSKATNPNFVINSFEVSIEYISLVIVGVLVVIAGDLIIDKKNALSIMSIITRRSNGKKI